MVMRRKREDQKATPEKSIAKPLLRRKAARRKAYFERLEEHPDAPNDPELAEGSEPPAPHAVKNPAVNGDIIIKLLKREAARRKRDLRRILETPGLNLDRTDRSEPLSEEPRESGDS
jgi:hypothetical protein